MIQHVRVWVAGWVAFGRQIRRALPDRDLAREIVLLLVLFFWPFPAGLIAADLLGFDPLVMASASNFVWYALVILPYMHGEEELIDDE